MAASSNSSSSNQPKVDTNINSIADGGIVDSSKMNVTGIGLRVENGVARNFEQVANTSAKGISTADQKDFYLVKATDAEAQKYREANKEPQGKSPGEFFAKAPSCECAKNDNLWVKHYGTLGKAA